MGKIRMRGGRQGGQTLIIFAIAMPLFLSLVGLVVDGSSLMVHRRSLQVAADAAALAVAQDLNNPSCPSSCLASEAGVYSSKNGGTDSVPACTSSSDTNCYQTPYKGNPDLVEVRLTSHFTGFFASAIGFSNLFGVSARAVASATPLIGPPTVSASTRTGTTVADSTSTGTNTITYTTTTTTGGEGAVAFTLSSDCKPANNDVTPAGDPIVPAGRPVPRGASIQWSGAASSLKALMTNGGIEVAGANTHHADHLALGQKGGTNCAVFGSGADFPDITGPFAPVAYPVPPPNPAPPAGCTSLGNSNFTIDASWLPPPQGNQSHPPGVYCLTGTTALLKISANSATFSGYTFFAPRINVSSNGTIITAPGGGPRSTVFDAYGFDVVDGSTGKDLCTTVPPNNLPRDPTNCALSITGHGNSITGDIFAADGTIWLAGGDASSGNGGTGLMESLKLLITGNFANYNGTGPAVGGTTTTSTSTSTSTSTTTITGFTDPGTTVFTTIPGTTTGADIGLDE